MDKSLSLVRTEWQLLSFSHADQKMEVLELYLELELSIDSTRLMIAIF